MKRVAVFTFAFGLWLQLHAMDRWAALSLIESGDNDHATGPGGEVSRYQVKPDLWQHYAPTNADPSNPQASLAVAQEVMQERCAVFEHSEHRPPTDFEFYVLWNAPAQIQKPNKVVAARAERFCNLVKVAAPSQPVKPDIIQSAHR